MPEDPLLRLHRDHYQSKAERLYQAEATFCPAVTRFFALYLDFQGKQLLTLQATTIPMNMKARYIRRLMCSDP